MGGLQTRRTLLRAWIALQVGAATVALVFVLATMHLEPAIAFPGLNLAEGAATVAGAAFWLAFGLVGGIRARLRPGGGVMTFSMPFIVAATVLGGPLAGGLMGVVSELEVREIRTQPWYGTLANHAVSIISAIVAGFAGIAVGDQLTTLWPGQEAVVFFIGAVVIALVFDITNVLLVIPTLALRYDLSISDARRTPDASFRATAIAEGILAWNMAAGYLHLGWWAPVVTVALVLIVWQAYDLGEALTRDPKTGLHNDAGLLPRVTAAIKQARAGHRTSALLLLDLDRFKQINDAYLYEAGDEVLITSARRILTAVRATDVVARMNQAGDEFAILLDRIPDIEAARALALRVQDRLREPIRLRTAEATVRVDASIGVVLLDVHGPHSVPEALKLADVRMTEGKLAGSGVVAEGADDAAAGRRRQTAAPRRQQHAGPPPSERPGRS